MAAHERYSKVGPFILMDTLGVGSFGKVKLAVHSTTYARYACKILDKSLVRERVQSLQVQKEIDIMQRLEHRNTVSLVSVLSSASKVFIVMELVTGGELFDEILRHKRLSEPYARFYFRQLIEGLQHCHEHGVYHRDLKPENLLLDENKTLKITDFGLSTLRSGAASTTESVTGSLTLHTQCGTPNYVAPEIITLDADGYSGAKVDAWSCGIILYVLVAGALPFDASEMDVLFKLILRCDLTYPPFFSDSLIDLISNLLKTNPTERYSLANVKQHPWYNGPVESSMEPEQPMQLSQQQQPFTPAPASQSPATTESPRSVSNDFLHDQPPPSSGAALAGQASLLSQLQLDARATKQDVEAQVAIANRTADSLDLGIRAESVESDFSIPSALAAAGPGLPPRAVPDTISEEVVKGGSSGESSSVPRIPPQVLPAAISEEAVNGGYGDAARRERNGRVQFADELEMDVPPGAEPSPLLNRLRSRVLASSGGYFAPSSDDEQEFEEAEELGMPDGFFGLRVREVKATHVTRDDSAMRRAYSLNNLSGFEASTTPLEMDNGRDVVPDVDATGRFGMRGRVKRQLWDRAAETWRIPGESHHSGNVHEFSRSCEQNSNSARDYIQSTGRKIGQSRISGDLQQRASLRRSNSMGRPASMKSTSLGGDGDLSNGKPHANDASEDSDRLVRTNSHDGTMTVPATRRRPRAHESTGSASAGETTTVSRSQNGVLGTSTTNGMKGRVDSLNLVAKTVNRDKSGHEGRQQKRRPGTVRFLDVKPEPRTEQSSFRPDGDWVASDLGKMLWNRMMKEYEMIYDDDEFDMDSSSLNEIWTKGLAKENLGRKSSFAAARFGSPTFVPSRSTQYLSSQTSRFEVKKWEANKAALRKTPIDSIIPPPPVETPVSIPKIPVGVTSSHPVMDNAEGAASNSSKRTALEVFLDESEQEHEDVAAGKVTSSPQISDPIQAAPIVVMNGQASPPPAAAALDGAYSARMVRLTGTSLPPIQSRNTLPATSQFPEPREAGLPLSSVPPHMTMQAGRASLPSSGRSSPANTSRPVLSNDERDIASDYGGRISPQVSSERSGATLTMDIAMKTWSRDGNDGTDGNISEGSGTLSASSEAGRVERRSSRRRGSSEPRSEVRSAEAQWAFSDRGTASSPVDSVSSGAMRSGGSDGLMSTPRDPEASYGGTAADLDGQSSVSVATRPLLIRDGAVVADGGLRSANAEDKTRPPMISRSKSRREDDQSVSPFSLEIPGPKGKSLPAAKPLQGLFPVSNPARPLLRKAMAPLHIKSYTEFHSLLEPLQCYTTMQGLLREYGCSMVKGTVSKVGEKYKIRCESQQDGSFVTATVSVYKVDNQLTVVLFKRKSKSDHQEFFEFYAAMHRMYCEKWKTMSENGDLYVEQQMGRRRGRRSGRNRVQFERSSDGHGLLPRMGSNSAQSARGSSMRTDSSDSGSNAVRKCDIECVTPTS